jgi:HK97 family phage major capsid protein
MNLEELRKRLADISAKLETISAGDLNDAAIAEVETLHAEFEETKKKIEAIEKMDSVKAQTAASTRKVAPQAATKVEVGETRLVHDPKGGFVNQGEFFKAVANAALSGNSRVDQRLIVRAGMKESIGEDGGFLIPADFRQSIEKKVNSDESLLPKTRQFQTSSNILTLPTNEAHPWDATCVKAYWDGEAVAATESKPQFGETSMKLHKLTALVKVTDELLEDAPALESWIKGEAPVAMVNKINNAIIAGSGAGQPLGILNSGFKYQVAKESGQAADTVVFENINKMYARIIPASIGKSVWLVNPAVLPQLRTMKFDVSNGVPAYLPTTGISGAPYGTLFGIPLMPMLGGVKALGDEGDIVLADLSFMYTAYKTAGVKSEMSTHVYFSTSETAFKFTMRLAGQCPFKTPIKTEHGAYELSAFVTLADRA